MRRRIDALRAEADEVADKGGELTTFWAELRSSEDAVGTIVLEPLRRAGEALQEARAEVLMRAMQALRPRLMLSHRLGVDISEASSLLDEARDLLARRELSTGLELTHRARERARRGPERPLRPGRRAGPHQGAVPHGKGAPYDPGRGVGDGAESRRLALAGKIDEARSLLAGAAERLNALMLDVGTRGSSRDSPASHRRSPSGPMWRASGSGCSTPWRISESGQHRALSELEEVAGLIQSASSEAAAERGPVASKRISSPRWTSPTSRPLVDEGPSACWARGKLLNRGGHRQGCRAGGHLQTAGRVRRDGTEGERTDGLEPGAGLHLEHDRAEDGPRPSLLDPADTAAMYADVISYATQLIRDELTSLLARLSRDIATARRNGVWVERAGKLSDDAAHKLLADDIVGCHATMVDARAELERASALHMETYNRIAFLTRALGQSGLPAKNPAQARLDATKRLFEAGKYDGARVSANACLQELEGLAAASLIPDRMEEARDLVALLEDLSLDMPEVHALMGKAEESYEQGRHEEALSSLKEIERAASRPSGRG